MFAFTPPGASEMPPSCARSCSGCRKSSRWLLPGERRAALNPPSAPDRNVDGSSPRAARISAARPVPPSRESEPRAPATGCPASSTTRPESVAPSVSGTSSFFSAPAATVISAADQGTCRASSAFSANAPVGSGRNA